VPCLCEMRLHALCGAIHVSWLLYFTASCSAAAAAAVCTYAGENQRCCAAAGLMTDIFRLIDGCVDLDMLRCLTLLLNALLDDSRTQCFVIGY